MRVYAAEPVGESTASCDDGQMGWEGYCWRKKWSRSVGSACEYTIARIPNPTRQLVVHLQGLIEKDKVVAIGKDLGNTTEHRFASFMIPYNPIVTQDEKFRISS